MADSYTVTRVEQGTKQFQGMFSEMWGVTGTIATNDAVADDVSITWSITVPNVALGDMVLGFCLNVTQADANASVVFDPFISAANTVKIKITNVDETTDALDANALAGTFKMLIGRPAW